MFRWFDKSELKRINGLQLQTLRKVNTLMAGFNDVLAKIEELKAAEKRMADELHEVSAKLKECVGKEHIDPEAIKAAVDGLDSLILDMNQKIHADGM